MALSKNYILDAIRWQAEENKRKELNDILFPSSRVESSISRKERRKRRYKRMIAKMSRRKNRRKK